MSVCHTVITTCACVCVCIPFSTSLSHIETALASSWIINVTKCHEHGWLSNILRYKFVCGRVCCPWVCVWLEKLPTGPEEAKNINEDCDDEELISHKRGLQCGEERHVVELFTRPTRTVCQPQPNSAWAHWMDLKKTQPGFGETASLSEERRH